MLWVFWCPIGVRTFANWAAFEKNFCMEFFLLGPAKTTALTLHNREQYGQEKQTLDKYINSFWALVKQATYPDSLQLHLAFQDDLHSALIECIDNLAEDCPDNERIASWCNVVRDQWQLMEICWELCCVHPMQCLALVASLWYPIPALPMPAPALAIPTLCPLPLGILMDVDAAQQLHAALLLCQRCKKPGHFAQHCPLGLEVHYLSTVEQEELLMQLLATKDATRALLPNKLAPELTPEEINACASPPELEEDFYSSNR
ncbi:hypothetical protein C0989_005603 [Termitomyces sp. Mn162]|nr:hypothetical protein C0989_005603 [Termitomyces sp. Mn162]